MQRISRQRISRINLAKIDDSEKTIKRRKKELEEANTPERKLADLRRKVVQSLTNANKLNPDQREENTLKYVNVLVHFLVKEFEKVSKSQLFTPKKLDKFVENYSLHIHNLVVFDNEMVYCKKPKSNKSMVEEFNTLISMVIPVLSSRFINLEMEEERKYASKHNLEGLNV